jgi:glycosyltransferase involved in cell wall biosynthesis
MYTVVIPVYRNEESLPDLLRALSAVVRDMNNKSAEVCELVFVIDGSPDASEIILRDRLPDMPFPSKLLVHSRNFGSFAAIRSGLEAGEGDWFAAVAADLQEPPELLSAFLDVLRSGAADVVVGQRNSREDPWSSRLAARVFWGLYRWLVMPQMPSGGVDVFGCTRRVRDLLLSFKETNSALIGQLFWVGFRRHTVPYARRRRTHGRSTWSMGRKIRYMWDSVYSFSDLPIRLLMWIGAAGIVLAGLLGITVVIARISGAVPVPGYAATVITVLFFGALNTLGLGIVGTYAWRTFENTKARPLSIVAARYEFRISPTNAS